MTALLAIVTGVMMTAVGVAIAGLVLEIILVLLSRSFAPERPAEAAEIKSRPVVIEFKPSESAVNAMEWIEEAA